MTGEQVIWIQRNTKFSGIRKFTLDELGLGVDIEVAIDGGIRNIVAYFSPADRLTPLANFDVRNGRSGVVTRKNF